MGFLDPDRHKDEDDGLAGSSGLHVDLETKICPECRREALPWQRTCPACGVPTVLPKDLPPASLPLPHLDDDTDGGSDGGIADA